MSEPAAWSEQESQAFIDYGRFFVPERERQIASICRLIPAGQGPRTVIELACGEGLLAEAILEAHPAYQVVGLDGSTAMLGRAAARLGRFGARFTAERFDLADTAWRGRAEPPLAVVSSLAIHHLDGDQKRALFDDVFAMLAPGGAFVIADVVLIADPLAAALAADAWDAEVERRCRELGGDMAPHAFFVREGWNMYRAGQIDAIDKPSTLAEQLGWLRAAGFADVDCYWMLAGHAIFGGKKH